MIGQTDALEGVWILRNSVAWDEEGRMLSTAPYGEHPMGTLVFERGRMLAALCNGDSDLGAARRREYSSYGGTYKFDGHTLDVLVDIASDTTRIGGHQVREAALSGERLTLRPPRRQYGETRQQRELIWERLAVQFERSLE